MKSSQAVPGPQSAPSEPQGFVTGGAMPPDVSPAISQSDQVAAPKPAYGGVDVSPAIAPADAPQGSASAPASRADIARIGFNYLADNITPKNNNGRLVADALRNFGSSSYSIPQDQSSRPRQHAMGGWQSLMQRMQPR